MTETIQSYDALTRHISILEKENRFLKESLQAVKENVERQDDLIGYAVDAIFMGDTRGNITYANRSAATLTCYRNAELLAMNLGDLFSRLYPKLSKDIIAAIPGMTSV